MYDILLRLSDPIGIVGVILIFTMITSTLGFAFFSRNDTGSIASKINYNNYEFNRDQNNLWEVNVQGQTFKTVYNPGEVEDINLTFSATLIDFSGKPLYFYTNNPEAANEIDTDRKSTRLNSSH